ncbi:terminase large subunit domain-containing protein [Qipengyuania atrilutea]
MTERLRALLALGDCEREKALQDLTAQERSAFQYQWDLWARPDQKAPPGDWEIWMIAAGRGFGKTRAGAEWVRECVRGDGEAHIALIGASLAEARAVMVEGESGILAVSPPSSRPRFESSLRRLTWPNGAQATLYSAAEPDSLRGPQHSHARRSVAERTVRKRGICSPRCTGSSCRRERSGVTSRTSA